MSDIPGMFANEYRYAPGVCRELTRLARKKKRYNFEQAAQEPLVFPGEARYVLCPVSDHMHTPQALRIYPTVHTQWPAFRCSCQVFGYLSQTFDLKQHGYTLEQLAERKVSMDGVLLNKAPPAGKGPRFVICPMSYYMHTALHGSIVLKGPKRFHCRCGCGTNFFLPRTWTARHGYTFDQLTALGATSG